MTQTKENQQDTIKHKAGFVNIIGNPNVGKSTFLNAILDYPLAITTPKAQTTRHRILGILNGENYQAVFSDTPGVIQPAYELQKYMMKEVEEALEDADILLLMTEPGDKELKDEKFFEAIRNSKVPLLVLLNKIDLSNQEETERLVAQWKEKLPRAEVYPVSALHHFGIDQVKNRIIDLLPENPPFFPKDQLTDKNERFIVSEKIREKILKYYKKEIPYAVEVVVESFKEDEKIIRIDATIYVERPTQKGILIGHRGEALKRVGTEARKELEALFGKKIFLKLFVKVRKDWRKDDNWLRRFGYKKQ